MMLYYPDKHPFFLLVIIWPNASLFYPLFPLVQLGDLPAQEAKGKLKLSKEITQKQKVSPVESVSLAQDADDTLADKDTDPTAH